MLMDEHFWLNDDELFELTDKVHWDAQQRVAATIDPPIVMWCAPGLPPRVPRWQFEGP